MLLTPRAIRLLSRKEVWARPEADAIWEDALARPPLYRKLEPRGDKAAEIVRHHLLRAALDQERMKRDARVEAELAVLRSRLPELVHVAFTQFKADLPRVVPGLSDEEWTMLMRGENQRRHEWPEWDRASWETLRDERRRDPPPDLDALIERAGRRRAAELGEEYIADPVRRVRTAPQQCGYEHITPEEWAEYDQAEKAWRARMPRPWLAAKKGGCEV